MLPPRSVRFKFELFCNLLVQCMKRQTNETFPFVKTPSWGTCGVWIRLWSCNLLLLIQWRHSISAILQVLRLDEQERSGILNQWWECVYSHRYGSYLLQPQHAICSGNTVPSCGSRPNARQQHLYSFAWLWMLQERPPCVLRQWLHLSIIHDNVWQCRIRRDWQQLLRQLGTWLRMLA